MTLRDSERRRVSDSRFVFKFILIFLPSLRRVDYVGYPVDRQRHPVVDAGLSALSARITGRNDADQVPSTRLLQHQWSTRVALRKVEDSQR